MHARLQPARNAFNYGVYYVALPLSRLQECDIIQNRFGLTSFYRMDHGPCDGSSLEAWARGILYTHLVNEADGDIVLICMPRVLGYVFNPVSFWLCHDKKGGLRAVLCEVKNTFGERHCYLCAREDRGPMRENDELVTEKVFHVSPFLKREGHYTFRFRVEEKSFGAWIDYFNASGHKTLVTALSGDYAPLTSAGLKRAFLKYPLVTLKSITLIHWQALKIMAKGIQYIRRPRQMDKRITTTRNITKI